MKFVIATGGTGGHLFPAMKVAEGLKKEGHEIVFLGSFRQAGDTLKKSGFIFEELKGRGLNTDSLAQTLKSVGAMAHVFGKAFGAVRKLCPDAVIGFGGYGAFPVVLSAVFLGYPTMIHEQNVVPGRANALLGRWVSKIAISFQKSARYFDSKKTVLTGCPCYHDPGGSVDRAALLKKFGLFERKLTFLVFGGSQGSQRINDTFFESARIMREKIDFQVIHVCGKEGFENLQTRYHSLGIPVALFSFLDRMGEAYHLADVVICRAGAVTVTEIAAFRLLAVLIPYPFAQGHQKENAAVLCEREAAVMIEQKDLTPSILVDAVVRLSSRVLSAQQKADMFDGIYVRGAASGIAKEALALVR